MSTQTAAGRTTPLVGDKVSISLEISAVKQP